jgi:D-proline reductase (dithiol) PrdB
MDCFSGGFCGNISAIPHSDQGKTERLVEWANPARKQKYFSGRYRMNERRPYRSYVSYIDRSREYYAAQGYSQPYSWAYHGDVPFTPPKKPLSGCRVGLVTTAGKMDPGAEKEGRRKTRELYAMAADPVPTRLFTADLFWDKTATHTDDINSFLPLNRLAEYAGSGRIGSVSPRFYGVPTEYSQGKTSMRDAPKILEWCREDGVDAVLLSAL